MCIHNGNEMSHASVHIKKFVFRKRAPHKCYEQLMEDFFVELVFIMTVTGLGYFDENNKYDFYRK